MEAITEVEISRALVQANQLPEFSNKLIRSLASQQALDIAKRVEQLKDKGSINHRLILFEGLRMDKARAQLGDKVITKLMVLMVSDLCRRFNVVRNMTDEQILEYAVEQVIQYPDYRFEDFFIFFQEAKRGKFGVPFDHIDGAVIDEWFQEYHAQRTHVLWEIQDEQRGKLAGPPIPRSYDALALQQLMEREYVDKKKKQ